jgi:hypothetical protein
MELSFSLSNYSISYNLIKSIGFWDKYADAIAEDMHTQLKAIYARNGDLYTQIIYTPFNQLNIQSGSYIDNLKHKFWQGVRHAQGLFESSYCVNKFSQQKVKTFRMWMVTFFVMDTVYYNSLVTPIFAILVNLQMNFMTVTPARRAHYEFLHGGIFNLILVTNVIVILLHNNFRNYAIKRYYGKESGPYWRVVEYLAFPLMGLWVLMTPSIIYSTFKGIIKPLEYVIAPKNFKVQNCT